MAVYDPLSNQFPLLERYPLGNSYSKVRPHEAMARILQTHALTRLPFRRIEVIPVSLSWVLVPETLFDESSARDVLALACTLESDSVVFTSRIHGSDIRLICAWPSAWKQVIETQFEEVHLRHFTSILASELIRLHPHETAVIVHVQGFQMDIFVIKDGSPQLFNSFSFQSPEDFLYFVALSFDQFSLNKEIVPLKLIGEIEEGSAIYQLCYKYIRTIQFLPRQGNASIPDAEEGVPPPAMHSYFNLLHTYDADN